MRHEFELKRREEKNRPPEELLRILCGIYPENVAVQLFEELTGINAEMFDKDTDVPNKDD